MRDVLERVQSNGKHLLGLINDVLDLSKIEAGQLTLSLADYSLKDVVHGVFAARRAAGGGKKLGAQGGSAGELPSGHGDERRLTQVLLNLVGNAIKFTDQGEVAIEPPRRTAHSRCGARYRARYRRPIRAGFSRSSSRPTIQRHARRAARASDWQSPSASSRCMGGGFGLNRTRQGRDVLVHASCQGQPQSGRA